MKGDRWKQALQKYICLKTEFHSVSKESHGNKASNLCSLLQFLPYYFQSGEAAPQRGWTITFVVREIIGRVSRLLQKKEISTCSCWEAENKDDRCSRSHVRMSSSVHRLVLPCSYVTGRHTNGSLSSLAPYEFCISTLNETWELNGPTAPMTKKHLLSPPDTVWRRADSLKYWANSAWEPAVWLQIRGGQKWGVFFVSAQYRSLHTCSGKGDRLFVLHTMICEGEPQYSSCGATSLRMKLQKIHTGFLFEHWFRKYCSYSYLNGMDLTVMMIFGSILLTTVSGQKVQL